MTTKSSNVNNAAEFAAVLDRYYRAWFRYHPEAAVDAGVEGYAHLLTPFDEEAQAACVCLNNEFLSDLDEIDRGALDPEARLDYDLAYAAALLENRFLLALAPARLDPATLLPVRALYQLTYRPVADFTVALAARLEAAPAHLERAGRHCLARAAKVPLLWARSAMEEAAAGADFVRGLERDPRVAAKGARFAEPLRRAADAMVSFAAVLEREVVPHARAAFACGEAYFHDALRLRHFLDLDADRVHAFGCALFAETERALKRACREQAGHDDSVAFLNAVHAQAPAPDDLLGAYRAQMTAARDFVARHDLVTLPARERLDVVATPEFLRHQIPFAAYSEPAPNDPEQVGRYYVTPPRDAAGARAHNPLDLMLTCVHEAYPGHHLQFVTANAAGATRPRLLNPSATLYEGWALYCEQLMHERGFLNHPAHRVIVLKDRLWRALRVQLDVELHTRGLDFDAAVARMTRALGFTDAQARADLTWYTRAPTVPLSYAVGFALLNAARESLVPARFALKAFHDRVLSAGSVALPRVLSHVFGEGAWTAARARVFGERAAA